MNNIVWQATKFTKCIYALKSNKVEKALLFIIHNVMAKCHFKLYWLIQYLLATKECWLICTINWCFYSPFRDWPVTESVPDKAVDCHSWNQWSRTLAWKVPLHLSCWKMEFPHSMTSRCKNKTGDPMLGWGRIQLLWLSGLSSASLFSINYKILRYY